MINLLVGAATSMVVALFGTAVAIRMLRRRGVEQEIQAELPEAQQLKRGKPTFGGVVIVAAALAGYLVAHLPLGLDLPVQGEGLLAMAAIVAFGFLGFLDDYIKVSRRRSLGLNKRAKFLGQSVIAVLFVAAAVEWLDVPTRLSFVVPSRVDLHILYFAVAFLLLAGFSNAVNFTDGFDGLAAGSGALVYAAFVIVGFWKFTHPEIYQSRSYPLDLAIVAACMLAALLGFLWWNAPPARIIMGDTGSLPVGGGLAVLALLCDTQLLLPIMGGLFVMEAVSVSLQILVFHALDGRRLFRMAPVHYHFELLGWPEVTVIVRFWIISGLFVAFGLGLFYADFLSRGGAAL